MSEAARDAKGSSSSAPQDQLLGLTLRVMALATLVALVNSWTARHFGMSLKDFLFTNAFVVALLGVFGYLNDADKTRLGTFFQRIVARIFQWPVIVTLAAVFVVTSAFVSSVTVIADGIVGPVDVKLVPQTASSKPGILGTTLGELSDPDDLLRLKCLTSPFGRRLRLDVSGFVPHYVDVLPWTGTTVSVARDMQQVPSFVARLPFAAQTAVAKGHFEIVLNEGTPVRVEGEEGHGSLWFGPNRRVPPDVLDTRRGDLHLAPPAVRALKDEIYYRWLRAIESGHSVRPGDRVHIRLFSRGQTLKAEGRFTVGQEAFQDVVLE